MHTYTILCLITVTFFHGTDCNRHVRHRIFRQHPQILEGSEEDATIYASKLLSRQAPFIPNEYPPNAAAPPYPPPPPSPPIPAVQGGSPGQGGPESQSSSSNEDTNIYPMQPLPPQVTFNSNEYPPNTVALPPSPNVAPPIPLPEPFSSSLISASSIEPIGNIFEQFTSSYTPVVAGTTPADANPVYQSQGFSHKRRRKNILNKNEKVGKLLETGKKLLEQSTLDGILDGNDSLVSDGPGKDVIAIPIPKGVQLILVSKKGDRKVDETVNITSSTQKYMSFGNSTEIENVVEMEMEKKIEDEKGANKGLEEVRIVETERVKPLSSKNLKNFLLGKKEKMIRRRRFRTQHRGKRSTTNTEEMARPDTVFNKMAKRFFSKINRRERVVKENNLPNHGDTNYYEDGLKNNYQSETNKNDELAYHRNIINDFMKFFSMEMKKFQKIQENGKNRIRSVKHTNGSRRFHDSKFSGYKFKTIHNLNYPKRMKVFVNTNMSWETKINIPRNEPKRETEEEETSSSVWPTPKIFFREISTKESVTDVLLVKNNNAESRPFLGLLILSATLFSCCILICIVTRLVKFARMNSVAPVKAYRFYENDKRLGLKSGEMGKERIDYPCLEWQSESGDWLSEQETDFR